MSHGPEARRRDVGSGDWLGVRANYIRAITFFWISLAKSKRKDMLVGVRVRNAKINQSKNMKNKVETITINGADVELHWGEGQGLGTAVSTCSADKVGETGPSDGETFELRGKSYRLGQHDYSTDQPGSEDDDECTCTAAIYAVEE